MNNKIFLLIILVFFLNVSSAYSQDCSSIANVLINRDICNLKNVNLTGSVNNVEFKISGKSNEYTTFYLTDKENNKIQVFSYGHLGLTNNDLVNVKGVFYKENKKDSYIFNNEIETDIVNVTIIKPAKSFYKHLLYVLVLIASSIVIYLILKKKDWSYIKGRAFEVYIISLFNNDEWKLIRKSPDTIRTLHRISEEDSYFDFIIKHRKTGKSFIIQCKYRTTFNKGYKKDIIEWAKEDQIRNYFKFQEKEKLPYFVIIGLGNKPKNPEQTFLVSLDKIKRYKIVTKDYLKQFERDTKAKFTINEFDILKTN